MGNSALCTTDTAHIAHCVHCIMCTLHTARCALCTVHFAQQPQVGSKVHALQGGVFSTQLVCFQILQSAEKLNLSKVWRVMPSSPNQETNNLLFDPLGCRCGGSHISRGHSEPANFLGFGTFRHFLQLLLPCANMSSPGGGGVCVYFLKSARKRHFRNVWVWGGGVVIFQRSTTHGTVHTNTALHRLSIFIQNHCHCQHCFFQARRGPH